MLGFFRKYQWYFFLVITIVVVISFSFFGTYNTLSSNSWREQVAFRAVNGSDITRMEVDDMATFLASDTDDRAIYGVWGYNFLNDGVIRKDFLQTGLAQELVAAYRAELQEDLQKRLVKEHKFRPYTNPQARFLSMENAWNHFMPEITSYFQTLKSGQNATDPEVFEARVKLFLAEKKFPPNVMKQVLRYQESQFDWLTPDPTLERTDLSLFGYHHMEDWFGPRFTRLLSQFIINAAILAEQKGYSVSKNEVLADLVRNTDMSFQQNKTNPYLGVATPQEYFNEQLRRLGMDQGGAIKVWQQVMLFRRYFHDVGNSALVDALVSQKFNDYAKETIQLDLYRLPQELRLSDYAALQKFETYLNAVSKPAKDDALALPTTFLPASEVSKKHPELVQKRYVLEIAQVNKRNLQSRVGIKETWNWELDEKNWTELKKEFPELATKKSATREERLAALDGLDSITRARVDSFARNSIVDSHPEWLSKALEEAPYQTKVIGVRLEGGKIPFEGLTSKEKRLELMLLLDEAPLGKVPENDSKLHLFSADEQTYYRIKVIEKDLEPEILTYAEANADGTMDAVRDRILEKHYLAIRDKSPSTYQTADKSWKSFDSVRDAVADKYFDKQIKAIEKSQKALGKKDTSTKDQLAAYRFAAYMQQAKAKIEKDSDQANQLARAKADNASASSLEKRQPLSSQWLLERIAYSAEKNKKEEGMDLSDAFTMPLQAWSDVKTPVNGDLVFFQAQERGVAGEKMIAIAEQTKKAHALLSDEAQRVLMRHILKEISSKDAMSLEYLSIPVEQPSGSAPEPIAPLL